MHHRDETVFDQWPLVRLDVSGFSAAGMDGARTVGDTLGAAVSRQETFAAVVQMPSPTQGAGEMGVGERIRMLKQLRPGLKKYCLGLAMVVSAETQAATAKKIKAGNKMWGCPTFTTDNVAAATRWAEARITGEHVGGDS
ncbi:hypothetical protein [Pseudonocardia sp. DLS-67]